MSSVAGHGDGGGQFVFEQRGVRGLGADGGDLGFEVVEAMGALFESGGRIAFQNSVGVFHIPKEGAVEGGAVLGLVWQV